MATSLLAILVAAIFGGNIAFGVWSAMNGNAKHAAISFGAAGFMLHMAVSMAGR
jgi:hypothetical protein